MPDDMPMLFFDPLKWFGTALFYAELLQQDFERSRNQRIAELPVSQEEYERALRKE